MLNKTLIGHVLDPVELPVEEGRLKFLAKALGQTDPVYSDLDAARAAGYPHLPAPPTFPFMLEVDALDLVDFMALVGQDLKKLLHGEQSFAYHHPICAGDRITTVKKITDIFDKKNGMLEFLVSENTFTNQAGILCAATRTNYVFRNT